MRILPVLLVVLAVSPSISNAATNVSVDSISCSGSQTSSFTDVMTLSCTGDFSLTGGSIWSDTKLLISSGGKLTLDNLFISAPYAEFIAGTTVSIGPGASIDFRDRAIAIPGGAVNPRLVSGIPNSTYDGTISIGGSNISLNNIDRQRANEGGNILMGGGDIVISRSSDVDGALVLLGGSYPVNELTALISPVPEPSTYASMLAGLLALTGFIRAKQRRG